MYSVLFIRKHYTKKSTIFSWKYLVNKYYTNKKKNLFIYYLYAMDKLARINSNSQLRINKKEAFIQNWKKTSYCYTKIIKQKTKKKNSTRPIDFLELEKLKTLENLEKIRFFNDKKRKSKSKKARVNNFLVNNISRKTLKSNKNIAYLQAIAILSNKL